MKSTAYTRAQSTKGPGLFKGFPAAKNGKQYQVQSPVSESPLNRAWVFDSNDGESEKVNISLKCWSNPSKCVQY